MNRLSSIFSITSALLALACSAPAQNDGGSEPPPRPTAEAKPAPSVVPSDCVCGTEPGCPPCPAPSPTAQTKPDPGSPATAGVFPPKNIAPPQERTKKPGDGEWKPMSVHAPAAKKGADSPLYTTVLHPHKIRGDAIVQLVAIDTTRVSMDLVLGTDEPEKSTFPADKRPGLVPEAMRDALIAVTNGGFMSKHGGHGVGAFGEVVLMGKTDYCTYAKLKSGRYIVGTQEKIAPELDKGFIWFRQTPPCLIEGGVKHPDLANEFKAKRWGRAEDGKAEIRRTAVGFDADGRTLYFAVGDWVTPEWLTDALVAAGITSAAELDINWSYTRFIVYERSGTELVATSPVLTELKAPKKEYVKEASKRDFFMLTHK